MLVAYSWFVSFINYFWFTSVVISSIRRFHLLKKKTTKIGCVELLICIIISVFFSSFSRASRFWYQSNLKSYFKLILIGPKANKYWRNKMKGKTNEINLIFLLRLGIGDGRFIELSFWSFKYQTFQMHFYPSTNIFTNSAKENIWFCLNNRIKNKKP